MPDICGALESESGWAKREKYVNWFDKWVKPRYAFFDSYSLDGAICYDYRCSVIHQGSSSKPSMPYRHIIFIEPGSGLGSFHNNRLKDALNIDIGIFTADIINGCRNWLVEMEHSENYQKNWQHSMQRYPNGLSQYIVGIPVIA